MIALLFPGLAFGAGITAYLPVDLPPPQARQVALLFALADEPVMRRPVSLAAVDDAMARACPRDAALCEAMNSWLSRYRRPAAVTTLGVEVAAADDTRVSLPNRHGLRTDDAWQLGIGAHWQPSDHAILGVGVVTQEGEVVPTGTLFSAGYDVARLDVGFRDRWVSPLGDSAFLQSTHAATMLSAGISNERPITRVRLRYEAQLSRMSWSGHIADNGQLTSGHPLLAGLHLSIEPAPGWSIGAGRQLQFGGGSRNAGATSLLKAFFAPNHYDNFREGRPEEFGNQQAAWSSRFVYPGATPLVVSMEFAGEDTSHGTPGRLGNAGLSLGIDAPRLWRSLGMRYEISEWQNGWYSHHIYGDGMVNRGQATGHWGTSWRAQGDSVGGRSQALALQWSLSRGAMMDLQVRVLANQSYSGVPYRRAMQLSASYATFVGPMQAGAEVTVGRDVFGDRYYRLAAFSRMKQSGEGLREPIDGRTRDEGASMFLDMGGALTRIRVTRDVPGGASATSVRRLAPHLGVGLRRAVWSNSDLGVRLELDRMHDDTLLALRAVDYRYRLGPSFAVTAFLGAARLGTPTPAYGYYAGGGLQWRDVRPRWDVNLDLRYGDKLARDVLAPDGTLLGNEDSFSDVVSGALYVSRRF